jgi:hypothetical protein
MLDRVACQDPTIGRWARRTLLLSRVELVTVPVMRLLREESVAFQGTPIENSWRESLAGRPYDPRLGHGRVLMGADGLPAALIFGFVDDYFGTEGVVPIGASVMSSACKY